MGHWPVIKNGKTDTQPESSCEPAKTVFKLSAELDDIFK